MMTFDKNRCAEFAANILSSEKCWGDWFQCIGWERHGELQAVVVFNDMTEHNIEATIAAVPSRRWLSKEFIRAFYRYPFVQLGVKRLTAHVRVSNAESLNIAERVGFRREGVARKWFGDEDAIVLGLLESDFRYRKLA